MKFLQLRRSMSYGIVAITVASSVFLASCGGGGGGGSTQSAGIGGTGIVAGKITNFGSVYVNGGRYEIDDSQIIVDGVGNKAPGDLRLGMVVKLEVETENGVFTDKAIEVVYDDEIQGPVEATPATSADGKQRTFKILGQLITIDDVGTLFEGTSFGAIDQNDVLEISGFRAATGIIATYVKVESAITEVELQGSVGAPITGTTFMIGPVTVTYDLSDLAGLILQVGQNVEVKGTFLSQTGVDATEISLEDDDFGEDVDDISLQGVISNYNLITGEFEIDGLPIDTSQATELSPANVLDLLDEGVEVEVEGDIVGGVFIADEVELREGDSKLRAFIDTVNAPDFTVRFPVTGTQVVTVRTDSQTRFEDETGAPVSIGDLNSGLVDFVRVEGSEIAGNVVLATVVKRVATVTASGDPSPEDKLELEGKVDGFNYSGGNGTITVLGIEYQLESGTTSYEPPGNPPPIAVDDFVEVEDKDEVGDRADGIADEVEKE